jgi:hypothetical protein
LDRRIEVATKQGGFSNPSAFIRAAIERELAGRESGVDAAEERIAASLDRVMREIRGVRLGQQALVACVDSLVKTLLTCLAEPPTNAYEQAIARGKFRYDGDYWYRFYNRGIRREQAFPQSRFRFTRELLTLGPDSA